MEIKASKLFFRSLGQPRGERVSRARNYIAGSEGASRFFIVIKPFSFDRKNGRSRDKPGAV